MENLAAVISSEKAPLEVRRVETVEPGHHELLVKNELIAMLPVEAKTAKANIPPIQYPAILGMSFGGTVVALGPEVPGFQVGDKVAVFSPRTKENTFGSYQRYALAQESTTNKIPEGVDMSVAVSLVGNLTTVVNLLSGRIGLEKPNLDNLVPKQAKKILVYGGTSSVGSQAVQYAAHAGYTVTTTTSPKHQDFVSKLGATKAVDHTQDPDAIVEALKAEGPYDIVVDSISQPNTVKITAQVLASQGGGTVYALLPAFGPETLPEGVTTEYSAWSLPLSGGQDAGLESWAFHEYLPRALSSGKILPVQLEKVRGGLGGLDGALDILNKGVSSRKLLVDPWE